MTTKTKKPSKAAQAKQAKVNATIADELGDLILFIGPYVKRVEALKNILRNQGEGQYPGKKWTQFVAPRTSNRLDIKAMRAELTEECLAPFEKQTTSLVVSPKLNPSKGIVPLN